MVALTILTIGVLLLAGAQFATLRANASGYEMSTAVASGEGLMEHLKILGFNHPQLFQAVYNGNITVGGENYFPATVNGIIYNGSYTVTNDTPVSGLKRIDMMVSWVDNGNHSIMFTGRVSP